MITFPGFCTENGVRNRQAIAARAVSIAGAGEKAAAFAAPYRMGITSAEDVTGSP